MPYYNTVAAPDRGVNYNRKPHSISQRQWTVMRQMRSYGGAVSNFPGWVNILNTAPPGTPGCLLTEYRQFDGDAYLMVADTSKLYAYDYINRSLENVTGLATIAGTLDNPFVSVSFGDGFYVTNLLTTLHRTNLASIPVLEKIMEEYAPSIPAPGARAIAVLNDHLCLFNVADENGHHPQRFQWADEGSDEWWHAANNNDAGSFDIIDTADVGVGLYHLGNDLIAYKEWSICPITYIGGNEVFGRRQSVSGVGLLGTYALAALSDRHIFMGPDTFYQYSGGVSADDSIGDEIHQAVYHDLHPSIGFRSRALYMEETDEVLFAYPSLAAVAGPDKAVVYNAKEGVWYGPFPFHPTMLGASSRHLNGCAIDAFTDLQCNVFQIGPSETAAGTHITRVLETGDQYMGLGGTDRFGQSSSFPIGSVFHVNALNIELSDLQADDVEVQVGSRMDLNDDIKWTAPIYMKASFRQKARVPVRATGRWFRLRLTVPRSGNMELLGYQYEFTWVGTR